MDRKWVDYVRQKAREHGVPSGVAMTIFQALGPAEAHSRFIRMLEELARENEDWNQPRSSETQGRSW